MVPTPLADKGTCPPIQMEVSLERLRFRGTTFRGTCRVSEPQLSLMITVKIVLVDMFATGFGMDGLLNTLAGVQA